jgi:hypothetical protein
MKNDIYITDLKKHKRVTFDGSHTVFNGIPDWVYEGKKKKKSLQTFTNCYTNITC